MANKKQKPLLSIGMIFKNEIRCLERCLQSLQPLREAVPCELVMADTGSEDGSREIAAKYADILFDFPWINDFSAARNAVMDKCSGRWYFSIDADEWLEDIDELIFFLRKVNNKLKQPIIMAFTKIHNYTSYSSSLRDNYIELYVPRIILLSTGLRYSGTIHETWYLPQGSKSIKLSKTILHHDGYVCTNQNDEAGQAKQERNMILLREELAQQPENLRTLRECVESSIGDEQMNYACQLVDLINKKKPGWHAEGPRSITAAIKTALNHNELDKATEWIAMAEEMFPETFAVRLDLTIHAIQISWYKGDFADVIRRAEQFLQAYEDYHAGRGDKAKNYTLMMSAPRWKPYAQIFLAAAFYQENEPDKCWDMLHKLDFTYLNEEDTKLLIYCLKDLQWSTDYDVSALALCLWQTINQPDFARGEECRKVFLEEGARAFLPSNFAREQTMDVKRPAYKLFVPLGEQNQLGLAAMLMAEDDLAEMERLLGLVQNWEHIMMMAPLGHALLAGAKFPVEPMTLSEMDNLVGRLGTAFPQMVLELAAKTTARDFAIDLPTLLWERGLVLTAVQACDWQESDSLVLAALAQAFAAVEKIFLQKYYTPEMLCDNNIGLLPSFHAFGWYCANAFDALENEKPLEYVQLLRKGLELCPDMKPMVQFLVENTTELQSKPEPSAELLALAMQVRSILAAYSPDDPALVAIKDSPVYQQVAHLIESDKA